eukprot:7864182-Pyramimonas_sp.AAC.1
MQLYMLRVQLCGAANSHESGVVYVTARAITRNVVCKTHAAATAIIVRRRPARGGGRGQTGQL